jgi:hypothetical protein
LVTIAVVVAAGCGSDDSPRAKGTAATAAKKTESVTTGFSKRAVLADYKTMDLVEQAGSLVQECLYRNKRLSRCKGPVILGVPFKLGTRPGQITVGKSLDNDYVVSGRSTTGSVFRNSGFVDYAIPDHACTAKRRDGGCRRGSWFRPHLKFADEDHRGQDAQAQRLLSSLLYRVLLCAGDEQTYAKCRTSKQLDLYADSEIIQPKLPIGAGPGKVRVRQASRRAYVVAASSQSGNEFLITGGLDRPFRHVCRAVVGDGGCHGGEW